MRCFRSAIPALVALLLAGCAAPSPSSGSLLPPRDGAGAACTTESAPCSNAAPCCSGMVCAPNGWLGSLCRLPQPN